MNIKISAKNIKVFEPTDHLQMLYNRHSYGCDRILYGDQQKKVTELKTKISQEQDKSKETLNNKIVYFDYDMRRKDQRSDMKENDRIEFSLEKLDNTLRCLEEMKVNSTLVMPCPFVAMESAQKQPSFLNRLMTQMEQLIINHQSQFVQTSIVRYPMVAHASIEYPFQFYCQPYDFWCYALMNSLADQPFQIAFNPQNLCNVVSQSELLTCLVSILTDELKFEDSEVINIQGHTFQCDELLLFFKKVNPGTFKYLIPKFLENTANGKIGISWRNMNQAQKQLYDGMEALPVMQKGKIINRVITKPEDIKRFGTSYIMPYNVKKKMKASVFTQNVTDDILEDDGVGQN